MSLDATCWAWAQRVSVHQKIVLLSLADRAGENHTCFPSISRLSKDTGMSPRSVMRAIRSLEALGLVVANRERGTHNSYQLIGVHDRGTSDRESPVTRGHRRQRVTTTSDRESLPPVTQCHPNLPSESTSESKALEREIKPGLKSAVRSHSPEKESRIVAPTETENSVESTVIDDHQAEAGYTEEEQPAARTGKRKASAKGTRLPDDWKLPKPWGDWAMEQGLSRQDVLMEADTFRDYWISTTKNPTKRDWEATWRNWIRRAKQGTRHAERRHHSETPLQASLRESEEILQRARAGTLGTEWDFSLDGDEMFGVVQPPKRALPAQGSDGVPGEAARRLTHT